MQTKEPAEVDAAFLYDCFERLAVAAFQLRYNISSESEARAELLSKPAPKKAKKTKSAAAPPSTETLRALASPKVDNEFADAVRRYNEEHKREYPKSDDDCPMCGHHNCFGQLGDEENRWACFSASHTAPGVPGNGCFHGDALDLDMHTANLTRRELLTREGYLKRKAESLTDSGNAERLVRMHGADLRFCKGIGWHGWDGKRFSPDGEAAAQLAAKATARSFFDDAKNSDDVDRSKKLGAHAMKSQGAGQRDAMVRLASYEPEIRVVADDFDVDRFLFNVQNGTIDLRTGELRPHTRSDLLTKLAPVHYDRAATCPLWLAFLDRIMAGNVALVAFLQRAAGYSLTGDIGEHKLFFCYGEGSNGKTTFTETLLALTGDYGLVAAPNLLTLKMNDSHPTEQAALRGARFVLAPETEEDRKLAEATLKRLTGGESITARQMHKDFLTFRPTHKFWMSGNYKPTVRGQDEGIWRRLVLIPFTVTIPPEERDGDLPKKILQELPGILAWFVEGCLSWQAEGLNPPNEVRAATKEYKAEMDFVGHFVAERCTLDPTARTPQSVLYAAYSQWSKDRNHLTLSTTAFGTNLSARDGVSKIKSGSTFYVGIKLTPPGPGSIVGNNVRSLVGAVK